VIVLVHSGICDARMRERPGETSRLIREFLQEQRI
jgi:hypothetical protein